MTVWEVQSSETCNIGYKSVRQPCLEPPQTESNDNLGVATQAPKVKGRLSYKYYETRKKGDSIRPSWALRKI